MAHHEANPLLAAAQRRAAEMQAARAQREAWEKLSTVQKLIDAATRPQGTCARPSTMTIEDIIRSHMRRLDRGSVRRARERHNDARAVDRQAIIDRDQSRCYLCGKVCLPHQIHLDHIVPLARGGAHRADNLAVACAQCNIMKGARLTNRRPPALRGIVPPTG